MSPQEHPALPVPTEVALMIIGALDGIDEFFNFRLTSRTNRELCDLVPLATLRRLLQTSSAMVRSQQDEAGLELRLSRVRHQLLLARYVLGTRDQRRLYRDTWDQQMQLYEMRMWSWQTGMRSQMGSLLVVGVVYALREDLQAVP
ncbi:hypothetical protein BZA05DRAFT_442273 [Tricharina praecox]|uniref:uncharacterized protein n=1 Tax=Tricharina praecox TaxID=43433 RepID=UPI0022204B5C|nr:uncharacterized protein BZA05DRAFT_442273 [Tricharina praecox]KAI5856591.1 hypothetical protein BZA05DRAFT_442273 [Tricharina praecox]